MRNAVRIVRNGRVVQLTEIRPDLRLIDYLRLIERATGTKLSCGYGVCGACTVAVGRLQDGRVEYRPVNACSVLVAQLDGCDVVTIEDIAEDDGTLHPVQEALVEEHATQCGFCTPGMAMSLFVLQQSEKPRTGEEDVRAALQSNLCRCTGYRSIIAAGVKAVGRKRDTRLERMRTETADLLKQIADNDDVMLGNGGHFLAAPTNLDRAAGLCDEHPDAAIVTGRPGLFPSARGATRTILLSRVSELRRIERTETELVLGGAVTLEAALEPLTAIDQDIGLLVSRLGGPQERWLATLSDCLLGQRHRETLASILVSLGTEATFLRDGKTKRVTVSDIYKDDGTVDPELGQLLLTLHVPKQTPATVFRAYAVGERWEVSPPIVVGAFRLQLDDAGKIASSSLVFAGLSTVPKRSPGAEAALAGFAPLDRSAWPTAFAAMRADFAGGAAERAGARYRTETAQALLGKALIEAGGSTDRRTRLRGFREAGRHAAG